MSELTLDKFYVCLDNNTVVLTHKQTKDVFTGEGADQLSAYDKALSEARKNKTIAKLGRKPNKVLKELILWLSFFFCFAVICLSLDFVSLKQEIKAERKRYATLLKSSTTNEVITRSRIDKIERYIVDNKAIFGLGQSEIVEIMDPGSSQVDKKIDSLPEDTATMRVANLLQNHSIKTYKFYYSWMGYPINENTGYVCAGIAEFGQVRTLSFKGKEKTFVHTGLDMGSPYDTEVLSVSDGVVVNTGKDTDGGLFIVIKYNYKNKDILFSYYHLEDIQVEKDEVIQKGQRIGIMGDTGELQTGRHLHFEMRINGRLYNPVVNSTFNRIVYPKI